MQPNESIKEYLDYNEENGFFIWKKKLHPGGAPGKRAGSFCGRYRKVQILGVSYLEHRLAWFFVHGEWPKNQIDHINGDKNDNRISNLRDINPFQNMKNQLMHQNGKKFGAHSVRGKWHASVKYIDKSIHIGVFNTELEATGAVYGYLKGANLLDHFGL